MAAYPGLDRVALVAPLRYPVEDREGAHRRRFREVSEDIGSGCGRVQGRVQGRDRRQPALVQAPGTYLLLGVGGAEVKVEAGVRRGDPGDAPAHPLLVGLELGQRGLRD